MNVKSSFRKILVLFLILSMILVSCDVQGPDNLEMADAESVRFGEVSPGDEAESVEYSDSESDSDMDEVSPDTPQMEKFGVCSPMDRDAGECLGNEDLGYRELSDGRLKVFLDGTCYIIPAENTKEIKATKEAISQIKTKEVTINDLGFELGGETIGWILSAISALTTCGFLGASNPVGWACFAALGGIAVTFGLGVHDVIVLRRTMNEIEEHNDVIVTALSGKEFCQN